MNRKGFTLAETLITLSILGVVAVLIIPQFVRNYTEKTTVVKVKKIYSSLTDAYGQYIAGTQGSINFTNSSSVYENVIKPNFYIKTNGGTDKSLFADVDYYFINGTSGDAYNVKGRHYAVELKDGSLLWFQGSSADENGRVAYFIYDINGTKKPNKFGEDTFMFDAINADIYPHDMTSGVTACNPGAGGQGCTAWIIYLGNMKYLNCIRKKGTANWKTRKCIINGKPENI